MFYENSVLSCGQLLRVRHCSLSLLLLFTLNSVFLRLRFRLVIQLILFQLPFLIHFCRNVFSRKCLTKQRCESTGPAIFVSMAVTPAAGAGISPSTVQSARLQQPSMVQYTWFMVLAVKRIYTAHVTLKESARNSARAQCAWDSGSVTVLGMDLLTRTQAGIQCPGSTWKKYLPHRLKLKKGRSDSVF